MPLAAEALAAIDGPPRSYVIDNEIYEIMPDEWWPALCTIRLEHPWAFVFLLGVSHEADAVALAERVVDEDDPLTQEDLEPIAERLVEKATGRKWWMAARLAAIAESNWGSLDGQMLARGVDMLALLKTEPSRALNVLHARLYQYADDKRQHELDSLLEQPPMAALKKRQSVSEDAAAWESAFAAGASL